MFLVLCLIAAFQSIVDSKPPRFGNGVNVQAAYFSDGDVQFCWDLMKQQSKIKTVRIEIEPFRKAETEKKLAAKWIQAANYHGFQVIATCHIVEALGKTNTSALNSCAYWWKDNYKRLREEGGDFTINLMNEWGAHEMTPDEYARAYNNAIKIVRASGYENWIIIDAPGYAQEPKTVKDALPKIQDKRVLPSLHIYTSSFNQAQNHWLRPEDLDQLEDAIIGEFGSGNPGECDWSAVTKKAIDKRWPVLAWAWNGDGKTKMNMVSPSWDDIPYGQHQFPANHCGKNSEYFNEMFELL